MARKNRVQIKFPTKGRTKQSEKDACDINQIMARYVKTGHISHANKFQPEYGFATELDFRESMELIQQAQDMFDELPAITRKEFDNDPARFLEFTQNPNNQEKMVEMGLVPSPHTRELDANDNHSAPPPAEPIKPTEEAPQ